MKRRRRRIHNNNVGLGALSCSSSGAHVKIVLGGDFCTCKIRSRVKKLPAICFDNNKQQSTFSTAVNFFDLNSNLKHALPVENCRCFTLMIVKCLFFVRMVISKVGHKLLLSIEKLGFPNWPRLSTIDGEDKRYFKGVKMIFSQDYYMVSGLQ